MGVDQAWQHGPAFSGNHLVGSERPGVEASLVTDIDQSVVLERDDASLVEHAAPSHRKDVAAFDQGAGHGRLPPAFCSVGTTHLNRHSPCGDLSNR